VRLWASSIHAVCGHGSWAGRGSAAADGVLAVALWTLVDVVVAHQPADLGADYFDRSMSYYILPYAHVVAPSTRPHALSTSKP